MAKQHSPIDPLRVRILELCEELQDRTIAVRDYATTPDNAWLAKGELQSIAQLISDMELLVEEIRRYDAGED